MSASKITELATPTEIADSCDALVKLLRESLGDGSASDSNADSEGGEGLPYNDGLDADAEQQRSDSISRLSGYLLLAVSDIITKKVTDEGSAERDTRWMTDTGNAVGDEVVEELTEAILEPVLTAALDAFRMSDRIARTPECKALKSEDDQLQYITNAIVARSRSASLPTGADWTEPTTQNLKTALSHWSAKLRRNADLDAEPQPADNTLYWEFVVFRNLVEYKLLCQKVEE